MGGGFEIALACDLIIASEQAVFALPEPRAGRQLDARRGTIPSAAIALQSLAHDRVRPRALAQGVD
jgi:enoyl-CoA hydratase/carnithine racemase